MNVLLLILLIVAAIAGVLLAAMQLPGTWFILAAATAYDWMAGFQRIGWRWLAALAVVAAAAEVIELLSSSAVARKAGASRRASIGALVGGFIGMFAFSLPLPIIGTIAGGLIGCFAGALVAELTHPAHDAGAATARLAAGTRVGLFAALGRLLGLVAKTAAAFMIAGAVVSLSIF